jgi:hypothetical protein
MSADREDPDSCDRNHDREPAELPLSSSLHYPSLQSCFTPRRL